MKARLFFFLIGLVFSCLFTHQGNATSLYYILDGSGSMWGRVDGKMKIQAAQEVMTQLINDMPADIDSGLTVYGHTKKGDCTDITELISLGEFDRQRAIRIINAIKPKGKTPLADSITTSVNAVKDRDDDVTLVLVSDGIETCGGDPCAVTRALKESGVTFIMHVVGLDVDKKASEQLACIAAAGGGKYFSSGNGAELLSALSTVQKSVVEKTEIVIPDIVAQAEPERIEQKITESSASIRIKAKGPGRITFQHHPWLQSPYYWKLIDPETGEEKGRFSSLETTLVEPGEYQIVWDQYEHGSSEVMLAEVVKVVSGKTAVVPLYTAIRLTLPSWVQEPRYWGLRDPETNETLATFNRFEPFLVPAGKYDLIWRQGEHSSQEVAVQQVDIKADTLNDVKIFTAFNPVAADWVQKKIHYWGLQQVDNADSRKWVAWFSGGFSPQLVPVGRYKIIFDLSEHGSSDSVLGEVEVKSGAMNEFKINTGFSFIAPKELASPYFIDFIELDSSGQEIGKVRLSGSFGPMALKPGIYKIDYRQDQHGGSTMTIVDSFELQAGNLVEIEL